MSDILKLEQEIVNAKEAIGRRQSALRLVNNPDFRKLFLEEYFVTEAARLVQLSGDPALDDKGKFEALEMAKATGHCKRYLSMCVQMGFQYENNIEEMEELLVTLRQEAQEA